MYEVDDRDKVVALSDIPPPDIGAPHPLVLANDWRVVLAYQTAEPDRLATAGALVVFPHVWAHYLGLPNDEALHGHPLANRGLDAYVAAEVLDSSWIRLLKRRNAVHPLHTGERFAGYRHFIFAFHDTTFECVANGIELHGAPPPGQRLEEMAKRLFGQPAV